jgi:acyl carrier protein
MTPREAVYLVLPEVTDEPVTDVTVLGDVTDSLGLVELAVGVEQELGITIPDGAESAWVTVGDAIAAIEALVRSQ